MYRWIRKIPTVFVAAASACLAQSINISGVVSDSATGNPLNGAAVRLLHSGLVDSTDSAGAFALAGNTMAAMESGPRSVAPLPPLIATNRKVAVEAYSTQGRLTETIRSAQTGTDSV